MWKGIDVSDNQGVINWQKAKAAGVQFAVLRSVRGSGKTDGQFLSNYSGCQANGIPVSVYKYTYADTEEKARTEAAQVVSLLNSVCAPKTTMVWWDVEDRPTLYNLGGTKLTAIIKAAKETIEAAGYCFGIYVGLYVYRENWFDFGQFADVPLWVARYPSTTQKALSDNPSESYKPDVGRAIWGWQYSSNGRVDGISTAVDLDICYQNPAQECPETDQTEGKAEPDPVNAVQKTVTANVLNIRAEPSASSADLGDLIKGSVITVDKTQDGWAHFEGWVSMEHLSGANSVTEFSLKSDGEKQISENFKVSEFQCKDGSDKILIDTNFVKSSLQAIRDYFGAPVTINSAYRTESYNSQVGGAKSSYHMLGRAFDIVVKGHTPLEVAQFAQTLNINGIIQYNTFVHVDSRPTRYWAQNDNGKVTTKSGF